MQGEFTETKEYER